MDNITFQDEKSPLHIEECYNEIQSNCNLIKAYNEHRIGEYLTEITSKYGSNTLTTLLSINVRNSLPDSRFDQKVIEWATRVNIQIEIESAIPCDFRLHNIHPVIINSACIWAIENEKNKSHLKIMPEEEKIYVSEKLYNKMSAEQDKFRGWLLKQNPQEILNHTFEYTVREDILYCISEEDLPEEQALTLLKSPCPLDNIYKNFTKKETSYMEEIRNTIEDTAKRSIDTMDKSFDMKDK